MEQGLNMPKEFNTTGTCIPEKHYMADVHAKLDAIEPLVTQGKYFIINRPRQYGKTTTMYLLRRRLAATYVVIPMSFEGMSDETFAESARFVRAFLLQMKHELAFAKHPEAAFIPDDPTYTTIDELDRVITDFVHHCNRTVVLFIDEVDKSSNNQLFLNFLGMLRNKYLKQNEGRDYTFHSVVLAGVHDVKNLKLKLRPDAEKKFNSPWNIAADFDVDMRLHSNEIETMLVEYAQDYHCTMDTRACSEQLYYYTNGYPFLVSKLCKIIDEKILGVQKRAWTTQDVEQAMTMIVREKNTLFDDLIKNLEHDRELYTLVHDVALRGETLRFAIANPVIDRGVLYGIIRDDKGTVGIDNRIFEQVLYDYMSSKLEIAGRTGADNFRENFIRHDNTLDMEHCLRKFQLFMHEQRSKKDAAFVEREGRLLFLTFVKPIINGHGYDFKEPQISEEKRLDIVITFNAMRYVVELKIWRGEAAHQKGLQQLADYLQPLHLDKGYLLVYDFTGNKEQKEERIHVQGKEIFAVWV